MEFSSLNNRKNGWLGRLLLFFLTPNYAIRLPIPHFNSSLTLSKAEQIAVIQMPELQQSQANTNALDQQAIAEGQLPA